MHYSPQRAYRRWPVDGGGLAVATQIVDPFAPVVSHAWVDLPDFAGTIVILMRGGVRFSLFGRIRFTWDWDCPGLVDTEAAFA